MMKKQVRKTASGVLVLHKTLDVLEAIKDSHSGLSLADLARELHLPKPTAYRIVNTLESRGYLDRSEGGRYQVARKLFELQKGVTDEQLLARTAQPIMERLVASCRETINLGVLDAGEVVVINTIESPQGIRMASKIGNRRYLHSTALGKALLSGLPEKEIIRLIRLKRLPRLTPNTITTQGALLAEVESVRERGFALDNEENELNGRCIAAPVLGAYSRVVAALSISAPAFRLDVAGARSLAGDLIEACRAISKGITG